MLNLVAKYGENSWKAISKAMANRTDVKCAARYYQLRDGKPGKTVWTDELDARLFELVKRFGQKNWIEVAKHIPGMINRQCRERYLNLKRKEGTRATVFKRWSPEEDTRLLGLYEKLGGKWSEITAQLEGRTPKQAKNRF